MGKVEVVNHPELEEACKLLKKWVGPNRVILIVANSTVNYVGRASSTLSWGEVAPRVARGVRPLLYRNGLELRILDPNKLKKYGSILTALSEK